MDLITVSGFAQPFTVGFSILCETGFTLPVFSCYCVKKYLISQNSDSVFKILLIAFNLQDRLIPLINCLIPFRLGSTAFTWHQHVCHSVTRWGILHIYNL